MLNPTPNDEDIERWFARYADVLDRATERDLRSVACWIPIIGLPANDSSAGSAGYVRTQPNWQCVSS